MCGPQSPLRDSNASDMIRSPTESGRTVPLLSYVPTTELQTAVTCREHLPSEDFPREQSFIYVLVRCEAVRGAEIRLLIRRQTEQRWVFVKSSEVHSLPRRSEWARLADRKGIAWRVLSPSSSIRG
jgi:hypothetical protein